MVLLVIADHASDDGTEAWPSQLTIATKASISVRTVQRAINNLEKNKYLWMEKRAGGSKTCREDRRPNRYTINIKRLRGDIVSGQETRGDTNDTNGATMATDTGRHSRHMNHPVNPSKEPSMIDKHFDQFWEFYPRKVARKTARVAYEKAVATTSHLVINGAAKLFADSPLRDPKFTPHPTTWLNQERWADDQPAPVNAIDTEALRAKEKAERERIKSEQVAREIEEAKKNAVPMPTNIREVLERYKKADA